MPRRIPKRNGFRAWAGITASSAETGCPTRSSLMKLSPIVLFTCWHMTDTVLLRTEGSIEAEKPADLIILSQDLFKVDPNQIGNTKVLMTMVGGKVVYRDPSWEINNPD
jgi:predicted amidohydrolase YtcJ